MLRAARVQGQRGHRHLRHIDKQDEDDQSIGNYGPKQDVISSVFALMDFRDQMDKEQVLKNRMTGIMIKVETRMTFPEVVDIEFNMILVMILYMDSCVTAK